MWVHFNSSYKTRKINRPVNIISVNDQCHPDPGKTLPESLDYNVFWLQTVTGEVDSKTGIPPPLLCLQVKDFLNGPGKDYYYYLY